VLSRTLGKIAFIHHDHEGPQPGPEEFWWCDIVTEYKSGQVGGCFLVNPVRQVAYSTLRSLSALDCTVHVYDMCKEGGGRGGMTMVVDPLELTNPDGENIPWFLSLKAKTRLKTRDVVAVVVNLSGSGFWELK